MLILFIGFIVGLIVGIICGIKLVLWVNSKDDDFDE